MSKISIFEKISLGLLGLLADITFGYQIASSLLPIRNLGPNSDRILELIEQTCDNLLGSYAQKEGI